MGLLEFVFWMVFIIFMGVIFPILLVGSILWFVIKKQKHIRPVPSTPYVIDQTTPRDEPAYAQFVLTSHPYISQNNQNSMYLQTRDVPPPYSSFAASSFPGLQTQLPYPAQNAAHFPNFSGELNMQFNAEKQSIFSDAQAVTPVQPSNPPGEPVYQVSMQASYQNELNSQPQAQATIQAQLAVPNSIPLQNLTRPASLTTTSSEQSAQNQFIPIPTPFTSQEATTFPPIPSSSSIRTVNSTEHDDPPPSYHKIDKL